jgi:hypothetical protein
MKYFIALIFVPGIIFSSPQKIFSVDASSFTIDVKNFNSRVYREKKSRFRLVSSCSKFKLVSSAFQTIGEPGKSGNSFFLDVETGEASQRVKPSSGRDLENTIFLKLDSSPVKDLARRFKASEKKPADIEKFVFRFIKRKTIGIPLMPSTGIIESQSGDCTEHSVLSLALLRANGIPSRAVVGAYLAEEFMGRKNVFVYHMWVEAYYKGRWRLVDATRPGTKLINRYIAFAYHSLKSPMPLSYLRTISTIQDMEITLLN